MERRHGCPSADAERERGRWQANGRAQKRETASYSGAAAAAAAGLGGRIKSFFFLQDKELSLRERPKRALGGESGLIPPPSSFLFSSLASSSPPLCVSLTLFNPT